MLQVLHLKGDKQGGTLMFEVISWCERILCDERLIDFLHKTVRLVSSCLWIVREMRKT